MADATEPDPTCPICLQALAGTPPQDLHQTTCDHWFHAACLGQWFRTKRTCPLCRTYQWSRDTELQVPRFVREALLRRLEQQFVQELHLLAVWEN